MARVFSIITPPHKHTLLSQKIITPSLKIVSNLVKVFHLFRYVCKQGPLSPLWNGITHWYCENLQFEKKYCWIFPILWYYSNWKILWKRPQNETPNSILNFHEVSHCSICGKCVENALTREAPLRSAISDWIRLGREGMARGQRCMAYPPPPRATRLVVVSRW